MPVLKDAPNPMLQWLGAFFKKERAKHGLSTANVASALQIADSYYRLTEAGRAVLSEKHVFALITTFHDSQIDFGRLAKYMVAAQWVSAQMQQPPQAGAAKRAMKALAINDGELEGLYERLRGFLDAKDDSDEHRDLLHQAAAEVALFLRDPRPHMSQVLDMGADTEEGKGQQALFELFDMYSLNADALLPYIKEMGNRQFLHTGRVAAEWEEKNARRFRSAICVYNDSEGILKEENLKEFRFWCLEQKLFKSLRMVFLKPSALNDRKLEEQFLATLDRNRPEPHTQFNRSKVQFKSLTPDQLERHKERLHGLTMAVAPNAGVLDGYWSYTTEEWLEIGIGRKAIAEGTYEVVNVKMTDAFNRRRLFEQIWKDV